MTERLSHRRVLARLPKDLRAALIQRSDAAGLVHLAGHLGLLALTGTAIALQAPFWPALLVPHGILLVFLFTLEHEATHQTPFATPWLNEAVGRSVGLLLCLPFVWFRYFHLDHHRYTNDPERDPELQAGGKPETWVAFLLYLSGWSYWRGVLRTLITNAVNPAAASYLPDSATPAIRAEARWMLALYACAGLSLLVSPVLLWVWLVPALLGQPFLRLYLLAEHARCAPVANMFENTRTTFTNRLLRFIAWNMPYHAEHHAWPQVPFHKLPDLHEAVADHLQVTSPSYRAFTAEFSRDLS